MWKRTVRETEKRGLLSFALIKGFRPVDLRSALGKKRRDGKSAPLQPLTTIQRVHIGRLIAKHGDNFQVQSWSPSP